MSDRWHHTEEGFYERLRDIHERIRVMENFGGLRIWILYALKDGPKNGVEIMDAIQEESRFFQPFHHRRHGHRFSDRRSADVEEFEAWRPSPGSIYPMLNKMTNENLITKKEGGRYEMTLSGRDAFSRIFRQSGSYGVNQERGPYSLENVLKEMNGYASYLGDIAKEKLIPQEATIDEIIQKLTKVKESLHKRSNADGEETRE